DPHDVVELKEVRRGQREDDDDHDQRREREKPLDGVRANKAHAPSLGEREWAGLHAAVCGPIAVVRIVAKVMIFSCVASAPLSSPRMRPSHITTMRWLMRRISGSSEEIMMIAFPCLASSLSRW